jgi:membrane protein involved in colicin uptake
MENQLIVSLPQEVAQIAENVSVEKRNEVQTVLNQVFNGVSKMREQLDTVQVADENDKTNMKLANTIRLGVRQVRLDAEKTFDAKRAEVQTQMLSFKTEDQLWLKAKQTMQILTKEIEEQARWKEETRVRYEAEQKELKVQQRIVQVSKFSADVQRSEFESMSDTTFEVFLAGIEKAYNDKVEAERIAEEARVEQERRDKLYFARLNAVSKYESFSIGIVDINSAEWGTMSDEEYNLISDKLLEAKQEFDERQETIRLENARLKAEAEAKEKTLAEEREKQEKEKKAAEDKAAKEKAEADAKLKAEREAREKLEAELKAKEEAERKAEQERLAALEKERKEAEKLAKAPIKKQLALWVDTFELPKFATEHETAKAIFDKFEAFKVWAKNKIETEL